MTSFFQSFAQLQGDFQRLYRTSIAFVIAATLVACSQGDPEEAEAEPTPKPVVVAGGSGGAAGGGAAPSESGETQGAPQNPSSGGEEQIEEIVIDTTDVSSVLRSSILVLDSLLKNFPEKSTGRSDLIKSLLDQAYETQKVVLAFYKENPDNRAHYPPNENIEKSIGKILAKFDLFNKIGLLIQASLETSIDNEVVDQRISQLAQLMHALDEKYYSDLNPLPEYYRSEAALQQAQEYVKEILPETEVLLLDPEELRWAKAEMEFLQLRLDELFSLYQSENIVACVPEMNALSDALAHRESWEKVSWILWDVAYEPELEEEEHELDVLVERVFGMTTRYKGLYYLVEHYFALPLPGHIQVSAPEEESESDESAEWSEEDGWGDESEWLDEEESGENQEEEQEE